MAPFDFSVATFGFERYAAAPRHQILDREFMKWLSWRSADLSAEVGRNSPAQSIHHLAIFSMV